MLLSEVIILITYLAKRITEFFIGYGVIKKEDSEIYQYGNEIVISSLLDFFILLAFAIAFKDFINVFLFWIVFFILRKFGGGYHANTYLKCKIVFSVNIFIVMIIMHNFKYVYNIYLLILMTAFTCISVFILAPVDNENKPLSENEKRINALKCRTFLVIICILSFVLFDYCREISLILVLSHFSVAFAMIFEVVRKNKN